jgi:hypothetical protein
MWKTVFPKTSNYVFKLTNRNNFAFQSKGMDSMANNYTINNNNELKNKNFSMSSVTNSKSKKIISEQLFDKSNSFSRVKQQGKRKVFSNKMSNSAYIETGKKKKNFFNSSERNDNFNSNKNEELINRNMTNSNVKELYNINTQYQEKNESSVFLNKTQCYNRPKKNRNHSRLEIPNVNPNTYKSMEVINEENNNEKKKYRNSGNMKFDISLNSNINQEFQKPHIKSNFKFGNPRGKMEKMTHSPDFHVVGNSYLGKRDSFPNQKDYSDIEKSMKNRKISLDFKNKNEQDHMLHLFKTPENTEQSNISSTLLYNNLNKSEFEQTSFNPFKEKEYNTKLLNEKQLFDNPKELETPTKNSNPLKLDSRMEISGGLSNKNNLHSNDSGKQDTFQWKASFFNNQSISSQKINSGNSLNDYFMENKLDKKNDKTM